jgi:hypothetical protein
MKNLFFTASAVALTMLASCSNENSVNPRPVGEIISKQFITGIVKAELNNTTPTTSLGNSFADAEFIPANLTPTVIAEIDTKDLVLNQLAGVTYAKKTYPPVAVGADGTYSVEVEVGPKGFIDVTLYYSNFRSDFVFSPTTTLTNQIFKGNSQPVRVTKGRNEIAPNYLITR